MVHLTLEPGYGVPTMLGVAALAIVLAAFFYRRSFGALPPRRWWSLFALRTAAILLVTFLLFRPVLRIERDIVERRNVVLLLDTSSSMATADDADGTPRLVQARDRIRDWAGKLSRNFDVRLIGFSDRATPIEKPEALGALRADGQATSITRALVAASRVAPAKELEAAVLFSDGLHNATGDPVAAASRLGLVVHTVGVGNSLKDSPSYQDARVAGLECPESLPVNNRARIVARVAQVGMAGRVVPVALEEDGKPVATTQLTLAAAGASQDADFEFVPTVQGRHTYTVRIPDQPGERIAQNNHRSAVAQVVEAKIRVLYLEGTLRAEYGAIVQRFLSKDPDVEFCALVQTRPNVFQQRSNIADLKLDAIPTEAAQLDRFDVIVVGDLDSTYFKPPAMERLVDRVRAGAGLLMLGGYHSLGPGGYGGSPLEAILPVETGPREIGQHTDPFLPLLTPEGRVHPIFANIAGFFPAPGANAQEPGLPPLDGCTRVVGPRPGATVLATTGTEASTLPVVAVQPVGKGRSAVFTGDTTRNWHQVLRALDQESPFQRFWGQMIRWLANRADPLPAGAHVTARTDKIYYDPDAPITVLATVRDTQGEGTEKAGVTVAIRGAAGAPADSAELSAVPGSPGQYSAVLGPRGPGTYSLQVEAKLGDQALRADPIEVEVGRPNLEFDRLDLDDALLTKLATAARGQYRHIRTADRLLDDLDRRERKRHLTLETPLYRPWPFWTALVGLLTAEWFLRRRFQLR